MSPLDYQSSTLTVGRRQVAVADAAGLVASREDPGGNLGVPTALNPVINATVK